MRILAKELIDAAVDGEVTLSGWVHRIRDLGAVSFVLLRDRSGIVQLVFNNKPDLSLESVITVSGAPARNPKAPNGIELRVTSCNVLARAESDLPFQVNGDLSKVGLDAILENRLLSLRHPKIRAIFAIQATIIEAFSEYLRAKDFTEIKTSKLVAGGTEGGTELFEVEYFDKKVCLAQSPQFYKETCVAAGFERVFEVAQAYRAEKHDTPRHLNEYVSMDVEMGFIDSEKELIELEKGILAHIFEKVSAKCPDALSLWGATVPESNAVANAPTIGYEEAVNIASRMSAERHGARIFDITPEAERYICEWAETQSGIPLVFVNEFPRRYRPFYTYPLDATRTMSFDALFRGLEITTGGRRQHNLQAFLDILPKFGLSRESFEDGYVKLLRYGCPPHGGFAIGCERLTARILGLPSVKEASLFPRDRKRVTP
jgi:nondiscriminating aspartyl-tRNA synthetase